MGTYNEWKFITGAYYSGKYPLKSAASEYLIRRIFDFMKRNRRKHPRPWRPRIAMSVNHAGPDDTAYYNDELAASCGL